MAVDACQLAGLALPWLSALLCPERPALTLACDLLQDSAERPLGLAHFVPSVTRTGLQPWL